MKTRFISLVVLVLVLVPCVLQAQFADSDDFRRATSSGYHVTWVKPNHRVSALSDGGSVATTSLPLTYGDPQWLYGASYSFPASWNGPALKSVKFYVDGSPVEVGGYNAESTFGNVKLNPRSQADLGNVPVSGIGAHSLKAVVIQADGSTVSDARTVILPNCPQPKALMLPPDKGETSVRFYVKMNVPAGIKAPTEGVIVYSFYKGRGVDGYDPNNPPKTASSDLMLWTNVYAVYNTDTTLSNYGAIFTPYNVTDGEAIFWVKTDCGYVPSNKISWSTKPYFAPRPEDSTPSVGDIVLSPGPYGTTIINTTTDSKGSYGQWYAEIHEYLDWCPYYDYWFGTDMQLIFPGRTDPKGVMVSLIQGYTYDIDLYVWFYPTPENPNGFYTYKELKGIKGNCCVVGDGSKG